MHNKENLRTLVKTLYDFQSMRIRVSNRLKKKKDGSDQDAVDKVDLEPETIPAMVDVWQDSESIEKSLTKAIKAELKNHPVYNDFLKDVKGCGPLMSAVIISEYDIHRATTVSKLWQFTGLNPGMVRGIKPSGSRKDGTYKIVKTDTMVRGDRRTAGFLSPFNGWLRAKMCGVLAGSFMKCNSPYREFYDNYKNRLEHTDGWKDKSKGHRNNAAKRYMIKMFLLDLYKAWRKIEGLEVRKPYQEDYLNHKHVG
jgi:hypothetical protein